MRTYNKGKISHALQAIHIIPLLFFGLIIMLLGSYWFTHTMHKQVETELANMADSLTVMYDTLYPGNYRLVGTETYQIYKGEQDITNSYALPDKIKEETGLDITLFYQDTRILTTIVNSKGVRLVGTGAPDTVITDVLKTGEPHFYTKTLIYGSSYFSYYTPLKNSDGSVVGMLFVGKPTSTVDDAVNRAVLPLVCADVILIAIVSLFTFLYTKKVVSSLLHIHNFLKEVSTGNLNASLAPSALSRNDELGEIANSALNMQRSLYTLVEQDALTSLLNRRSGDKKLHQIAKEFTSSGKDFCVALGDIDFFKKVNDTYGHECGDLILKNVAYTLRTHMRSVGFCARWGGEEFLLVFDNHTYETALQTLEKIMTDIRTMESEYDGQIIKVTMTFGLTTGDTEDVNALLRSADEKLYEGKSNGRNRIIT